VKQKVGSCPLYSVLLESSPKTMKRPIKILCIFSFDQLGALLCELDLIMTDLLKIKFWEPTFITFGYGHRKSE